MRAYLNIAAAIALMAGISHAGLRETYNVIKITNWKRDVSYEVVTDTQLKERTDEARKEAMAASKAAMLAQAEWRSDATYGKKGFPRGVMAQDSISKAGSYRDMGKAQAKAGSLTSRLAEKAAAKKKAESASKTKISKDRMERDAAQDKLEQAARTLYETKLAEVLGKSATGGDGHP